MSSSTLIDYGELYTLVLARIAAIWPWRRTEPRPSMDVETVITAAYHRIDEQDAKLKFQGMQLRLRDVEIELLQSDLEWIAALVKKTNAVLTTDDYIRLQRVFVTLRAMRSRS